MNKIFMYIECPFPFSLQNLNFLTDLSSKRRVLHCGRVVAALTGCGVIHQSETVEAGDCRCIQKSSSLGVAEVGGDREDHVRHFSLDCSCRGALDFGQQHGRHLHWSEGLFFTKVVHLK